MERWFEEPEAQAGLRFVGFAHELARNSIQHRGWYVDTFEDATACGVVYQLPAHHGHTRYLAGRSDPWNEHAACLDLSDVWADTIEAAHAADEMARISAESSRDYDEAWQAGSAARSRAASATDALASWINWIRRIRLNRRSVDRECLRAMGREARGALMSFRAELQQAREARQERPVWDSRLVEAWREGYAG